MLVNIKKRKFARNVIIGILALILVAVIINLAPGYKRNKLKYVTNLVIVDENVTERLHKHIYEDEAGTMYISKEDITLIDEEIYYNQESEQIIEKDGVTYIPIKEIEAVNNIQVTYIEDTNIIIIDKLNEGMIEAEAYEDTVIRYKQRGLSKKVGTLKKGEVVSAFYTTSKGWRLIRTEDGIVGYVKANTLTNEHIVRQDIR